MAAQQQSSSGENQVLHDPAIAKYFIVRSIFHKPGSANWTIGIALCPVNDMGLEAFKKKLNDREPIWMHEPSAQAEEFFESHSWFTIVRTSPPDGITCVGDIQGSIGETDEEQALAHATALSHPIISELTMTVDWVEAHVPRQNIGTILMLKMAAYAMERGVNIMDLDDDSDFKEFYTKLAFEYVDPAMPEMCAVAADVRERAIARLVEKGKEATAIAVEDELNKDVVLVTKWTRKGGRLERVWTEWRDKHERGYYRGKDGRLRRGGARVGLAMKAEPGLRF